MRAGKLFGSVKEGKQKKSAPRALDPLLRRATLPHMFHGIQFTVLFLLIGCTSPAADYYVSTNANALDANPGTLAQPWRTIQKAATTVGPGDTVHLRAGTYAERVTIANKHASAAQPIIFQTYAGDPMAAVDQANATPPMGASALLRITNCDHVTVRRLEFRNHQTASDTRTPIGILVEGGGSGVKLLECKVHDIWQSNPTAGNFDANAFGILVLGNALTPIDGFVLGSCEIYSLRTGASESVALNGNVTNFTVTNNLVHDCNNIGIDFIGFEGTAPTEALDQARGGLCAGNTIWNIDSKFNPAYGGNFGAGGGDDTRAAPGLYVDGGRDLVLERNHVHDCNFAVSLGSEHLGKATSGVRLRNNLLHHCHVGGIVLGGAETNNGGAQNCVIGHNTLYQNDTAGFGGGQVSLQHFVTGTTIRHNLMVCAANLAFILKSSATGMFATNAIDWNLYSGTPAGDVLFIWNPAEVYSFAAWKVASGQDAHSFFATNPGLAGPALLSNSSATNFYLLTNSPAVNAGDPAFAPANGERDHAGQTRLVGGRVDIGADEYLSDWQAWRDSFFGLPDGGPGAQPADDPDADGQNNLFEYTAGTVPTHALSKFHLSIARVAGQPNQQQLIFSPRLASRTYTMLYRTNLSAGNFTPLAGASLTDNGTERTLTDLNATNASRGYRVQITLP